jgi:hypothetical protein
MRTAAVILTVLVVALSTSPAKADECEDAGKIAAMLQHVEATCPGYRLTLAGHRALQKLNMTTSKFGQGSCQVKGQQALRNDLKAFFPQLGRSEELSPAMCDAVANLLEAFCLISDHQPLVEPAQ